MGRRPTTRRSPAHGGRELRVWLSAQEYAAAEQTALTTGLSLPSWVRGLVLDMMTKKEPTE